MAKWQGRSMKKGSGGRIWPSRKKRKYEFARETPDTTIGGTEKVTVSVRGMGSKSRLRSVKTANVTDPETGESKKCEIHDVEENPADPNLARRDIITKGAILKTDAGKVKVTSRPGQEGNLDAVLIEGDLEEPEVEEAEVEEAEVEEEPEVREKAADEEPVEEKPSEEGENSEPEVEPEVEEGKPEEGDEEDRKESE